MALLKKFVQNAHWPEPNVYQFILANQLKYYYY
jgi:hypothetical protein